MQNHKLNPMKSSNLIKYLDLGFWGLQTNTLNLVWERKKQSYVTWAEKTYQAGADYELINRKKQELA